MFTFWQDQCGLGTKVPKSYTCKKTVHQVVWTIRIRKVRFPELNSHRELEAFVDICLILDDQDPKTESRFSPKIMQIHCKPGGLEDKDPKTESGFAPKIMQKHSKPGSLEDQDPKSEIFKIEFGPKIPNRQNRTILWKFQQVMLNVHLLGKPMWIWHQNHANSL